MKSRALAVERQCARPPLASHAVFPALMWALLSASGAIAAAQPPAELIVHTTAGSVVGIVAVGTAGANAGATPGAARVTAGARDARQILTFKGIPYVESARLIARGASRRQPRTFAYLFTRHAGDGSLPATHSEEPPFVFASLEQPSFIKHPPPVAADLQLSSAMLGAWARFAANGDPNGPALPHWPRYDHATDPYLEFGTPIRAGHAYRKAQLDAVEPFYSGDRH